MTLYRQLVIAVLGVLAFLYCGSITVSFNNARLLVTQQMQAHTQGAAALLTSSMISAAEKNDIAALDALFKTVSDNGDYRQIYFVDTQGAIQLERVFPLPVDDAPHWFIRIVALPDYEASGEVASGSEVFGKVVVVSHPGRAYRNLWQAMVKQLSWFSLIGVGSCIAAFFAVRVLLLPLRNVESQANSISEQQFVQQTTLPKTRELKVMVEAMNRLSARLEEVFLSQTDLIRDLRLQSCIDSVTGLSNRADFDARLNVFTRDDTGSHCGALMIFALHDLDRINDIAGRSGGNDVLKAVAHSLSQGVGSEPQALVARRQGQEFSIFVPDLAEQEAEALAASLAANMSSISWQHQEQLPLFITMGFTYSSEIRNGPELLSEADIALHSIDVDGGECWSKFSSLGIAGIPTVSRSVFEAKEFIAQAITDRAIELRFQQTVSVPDKQIVGHEVYARFRAPDDYELTAATVMPMVQRFGLAVAMDKLVLECLAEMTPAGNTMLSVNMNAESISDALFCGWLADFLVENRELAERLVIEVPEHALKVAEQNIRSLASMLARSNSGLAIDHFGLESSAFAYLASMPLRYLKIHRSFIKNIHLSTDNQFYIKSLAQLTHMRGIQIVIEGVETDTEWQVLSDMNIAAAQGFLLAYPEPLLRQS